MKHTLKIEFESAADCKFVSSIVQVLTDPFTRATAARIRSGSMSIAYGRRGTPASRLGGVLVPLVDQRRAGKPSIRKGKWTNT